MFKPILRTNSLQNVVRLRSGLCNVSSTLPDQQNKYVRKGVVLKERLIDSSDSENFREFNRRTLGRINRLAGQDDDLIKSLYGCKSVEHLLRLVRPYLSDEQNNSAGYLKPNHLEMIYNLFRRLFHELKFKSKYSFDKFFRALDESPEFERLLHRTGHMFGELSVTCLIDVLYAFTLILNKDPQSKLVRGVIRQLSARLSSLSLAEIADALEILNRYQINPLESDLKELHQDYLFQFTHSLAKAAERRLMTSDFRPEDLPIILRYFLIFLDPYNDPTRKTVIYLANRLSSPNVEIDFEQSVMLMRRIKTSHFFVKENRRRGQNELFTASINQLISKCNSVIRNILSSERRSEDFDFYLLNIHDFINTINYEFPNFYDKQLIGLLGDFLVENVEANENYKHLLYNLVYNYAKFFTFDERLLKLLYDLCCENEKLVPKIAVSNFYYLFSRHRLPFVDHERLATKLLLNSSNYQGTMDYYKQNPLKMLCQLILNDLTDERLLIFFESTVDKLDEAFYRQITFNQYKEIALARVLLKTSKVHDALKRQIGRKLDRAIQSIMLMERRPKISTTFIRINNKLQSNAYLSNGVFIHPVGIYDSSIQDLIALPDASPFFKEIDRIPLTDNQEIVTFLESNRLGGNMTHEVNYNYQLKNVLKPLKIRPVDVYIEDLRDLSLTDQINFYVKKALDSYNSSARSL